MPIVIRKGEIYTANMVRNGTSSRGDWEMVKVRDRKKEITIWPDNKPSGVEEGGEFIVKEITCVKYGSRKIPDRGWVDDISVEAILTPTSTSGMDFNIDEYGGGSPFDDMDKTYDMTSPFVTIDDGEDNGDLPF